MLLKRAHKQVEIRYDVIYPNNTHTLFLPVFRGKIKVGDQSSSAEKKGRLLKTDTLIRRERVIRTLQSLMGDNVLTQPKSSDLSSPQAINSDQSLDRKNYR